MPGLAEQDDQFGAALVAGRFNDDAFWDVAVGAPGEKVGGDAGAGAVIILFGSAAGLSGAGARLLTQGNPEPGDGYGFSLDEGQIVGDGELVVGAPGETVGGRLGAGAVSVVKNDDSGFLAVGSQLFYQGAAGVPGAAEAGDGFGSAVAVGGFGENAGGLAVGVPG